MINSKIRIKLESFNHERLNFANKIIRRRLQDTNLTSFSIISLPTTKRIYCVLRSPHVDKDSREHFEIRSHKRLIEIYYNSNFDLILKDLLKQTNLPSGVFCKIIFVKG